MTRVGSAFRRTNCKVRLKPDPTTEDYGMHRENRRWMVLALVACAAAACERQQPAVPVVAASPAALSGTVTISGSSTVLPISTKLGAAFQAQSPSVQVAVSASNTSDGFNALCTGQLDIAGASRPITAVEARACAQRQIEFVELPIAFDSLSVVVNAGNTFVECLTVAELKKMWEPSAEARVRLWSDIRPSFPKEPLTLVAPGNTSGTFDYFTLAIVGEQGRSRGDYTKSDNDTFLADAVANDPGALGYFGSAYYRANRERLKLVSIDNGQGCVAPSADAVIDGTYQPLSRPLFFYATLAALDRPAVKAFSQFAVAPANVTLVADVGYVALPPVTLLTAARHLDQRVTGSIFGGRGSVLGVTVDVFHVDEKTQNALVR